MVDEVVMKVILTIVGFIVTGILGYLVAKVKEHKQKVENKKQK